jgi:hypothetical protein
MTQIEDIGTIIYYKFFNGFSNKTIAQWELENPKLSCEIVTGISLFILNGYIQDFHRGLIVKVEIPSYPEKARYYSLWSLKGTKDRLLLPADVVLHWNTHQITYDREDVLPEIKFNGSWGQLEFDVRKRLKMPI